MPSASKQEAQSLLIQQLTLISGVARSQAARRGLPESEMEEFGSFVLERLVEDDYRRLRSFRHECSFKTFVYSVVRHLLHDYCNSLWGKWRPSSSARSAGETAMALERLIFRDGLSQTEAVECLMQRDPSERSNEDRLHAMISRLSVRTRPRLTSLDSLEETPAQSNPIDEVMMRELLVRVHSELSQAVARLTALERDVLRLRFLEQQRLKDIASVLGVPQRTIYSILERIKNKLRKDLSMIPVAPRFLVEAAALRSPELDLDEVLATAKGPEPVAA